MFDYLRCEPELPDGWRPSDDGGLFQTKSFTAEYLSFCGTHTITEDGRLLMERAIAADIVPKEDRPYPNEAEKSILGLAGSLRYETIVEETPFHGFISFYGLEITGYETNYDYPKLKKPVHRVHKYFAKFTDSLLVEITGGIDADPPKEMLFGT